MDIGLFKEYIEEQARYIDEVRSAKHDMEAHVIVMQYYLRDGLYEDAKAYLGAIKEHQEFRHAPKVDTGNHMVDAVISAKLQRAQAQIEIRTNGFLPEKLRVEEYDLCTLFSNLISNAIEACEKLEKTVRVIRLEIRENHRDIMITMENPIEWEVDRDTLLHSTTKADKNAHGYGVQNVCHVVEKYHGRIDYEIEAAMLRAVVILADVIETEP